MHLIGDRISTNKMDGDGDMGNSISSRSVIGRTCKIYVREVSVVLPAAVVVFGITGVVSAVLIAISSSLIYVSFLISDVAITVFTGMVVGVVVSAESGRRDKASRQQVLSAVIPVLGELALVGIAVGVGVFIGFIFLIIPGLILATIWSVVAPIVVLERPGALRALGRSRRLVRNNGWQVFGVVLVFLFLVGLLASSVNFVANNYAGGGVGIIVRVTVGIVTAPLGAIASAVLYFDLCRVASTEDTGDASRPIIAI